ncbi:hypothetical protein VUR80DRAFT_2861 [Thermomyces stellatus]
MVDSNADAGDVEARTRLESGRRRQSLKGFTWMRPIVGLWRCRRRCHAASSRPTAAPHSRLLRLAPHHTLAFPFVNGLRLAAPRKRHFEVKTSHGIFKGCQEQPYRRQSKAFQLISLSSARGPGYNTARSIY